MENVTYIGAIIFFLLRLSGHENAITDRNHFNFQKRANVAYFTQNWSDGLQEQYKLTKRNVKGIPKNTGEIPLIKNLDKRINEKLNYITNDLKLSVGETSEMNCDYKLSKEILKNYPKATRHWIHNNHALEFKADRMTFSHGQLTIHKIIKTDEGVYLCKLEYLPMQTKTVAFFTLEVVSETADVYVQETMLLSLQCNSALLGFLFPKVFRDWFKEGQRMSKTSIKAIQSKNDTFNNANKSYQGVWKCSVTDPENSRVWTTASYSVVVLDPPSTVDRYIDYASENPVQIIFGLFAVSVGITMIFMAVIMKAKKSKDDSEKEFENFKESFNTAEQSDVTIQEKFGLLNAIE